MTDEGTRQPQTSAEWLEWHNRYRLKTRYTSPVVLERGEGLKLWDVEGNEYLDFHSGQVCAGIGHANPEFADEVGDQLRTLVQTGSIFTVPAEILVAKKLAEITPPQFTKSVFACSGAEAVEISLRLAKFATKRFELASSGIRAVAIQARTTGAWKRCTTRPSTRSTSATASSVGRSSASPSPSRPKCTSTSTQPARGVSSGMKRPQA